MVCPRIYANMYIFMPIYSQLSVLLRKKVASLARSQSTSQSFSLCLLRSQGRGSRGCCARGELQCWGRGIASPLAWVFGVRAASPWARRGR